MTGEGAVRTENDVETNPYTELSSPRYVRHVARPGGLRCTDETRWLVLEESPSFYIVYGGEGGFGVGLKLKRDYEVVA